MASTLVCPKPPGKFILTEASGYRSRAVKTVASGQTLKAGHVVCDNGSGSMIAITGTGNETHTYTLTGTPTAGTFKLRLWHKDGYWVETTDLAFDAAQATVDAAIEAVLGATVTTTATGGGTAITAIAIVFTGTGYASKTQPLGVLDWSKLSGVTACAVARSTSAGAAVNEVQTFVLSAAIAASDTLEVLFFTPTGLPLATEPIPFNTSVSQTVTDVNTAIAAAATAWYGGASTGPVAASSDGITWTLTYSGNGFAGKAIPALCEIDFSDNSASGSVTVARTTAGGKKGESVTTKAIAIAYDAVDASGGATTALFIVRDCVVDKDQLFFDGADPDAAATALEAVGIIAHAESAYANVQV